MTALASGIAFADLEFRGLRRIIATATLVGPDGITIIDPGPSSTVPALKRHLESLGATAKDVTSLLLTHIHLDHAGASGTLLRENPRLKVYVHRVGAPHMVDPSKLVASATRLWGDETQQLWGDVVPVDPGALVVLEGGEQLSIAGRRWDVAYTPGHASHHVSFFSGDTGIAFVGDTAGVRVVPGGIVVPPTPPPDIDFELWAESLSAIEAWHPQTVFLTHFGPSDTVPAHLAELRDRMSLVQRLGREALAQSDDDQAREDWFVDRVRRELRHRTGDDDLRAYEVAGRLDLNWRGLARYLTKGPRR